VLTGLYYLMPLDHLASVPWPVTLVAGLLILLAVAAWRLCRVVRVRYPALRAGEAPAAILPFASAAVRLGLLHTGQSDRRNWRMGHPQAILDLLALGLGSRVFIGAVQLARLAHPEPAGPAAPPGQQRRQPG
jgi:hypothetical protein